MDPLLNALGNVQSGELAVKLRGALAVEAEKQILGSLRDSVDAYGKPFAPIGRLGKLRHGQFGPRRMGKPLVDSGNLRGSRIATVTDDGIEVGFAAPYASYQVLGTRFITPRQPIPMDGIDGSTWEPAFERRTNQVMREALR
jgi:phage gpG-like protein